MGVAPFFDRVYGAVGAHLAVSKASLEAALQTITVGISISDEKLENDDWIADLTVNLLARLYSRIAITSTDVTRKRLTQLALAINPNIEVATDAPVSTTIGIGLDCGDAALYPSARGWIAHLDHTRPRGSGVANPYAAGAAAAFACAEMFRRVFTQSSTESDLALSLLDFGRETGDELAIPPSELRSTWFAGLGAVGNAALWALARDKTCTGSCDLIDHEALTLLNLQRYVLGTMEEVGLSKIDVARRALSSSSIVVRGHAQTLEQFAQAYGTSVETICVSVDNVDTRRAVQALLPRIVVNGWTGDAALGASWHVLDNSNACLACLYHPRSPGLSQTEQAARALGLSHDRAAMLWVTRQPLSPDDLTAVAKKLNTGETFLSAWRGKSLGELYTDVVCGAVPMNLPGTKDIELVPLAHQSVLAGLLMAAELKKRSVPELTQLSQSEPLVGWDDVMRPPPAIWAKPRAHEPGCICQDTDYQTVYALKWRS